MIDAHLVAFTLAAAALTIAPGPDTMLVIRNVLRGGRGDGIVTTVGVCSGLFVHATLSALGVSVILTRSASAFAIVKMLGALYLAWLGVQSLRKAIDAGESSHTPAAAEITTKAGAGRCFLEGFLSNVLNPKTAAFYIAFLPQFISATDPVLQKSLLLASIHYVEGITWLVSVSVVVHSMQRFVLRRSVRRWLEGVCGAMLVGFGARLAFQRR
jgi:RhtB (resistance to homoserine/threonine) family protein